MSPHSTTTTVQAQRQILAGTFVHSKGRTELEYLHDSVVCVDENGIIVKVRRDCGGNVAQAVEELRDQLGWAGQDVAIHTCQEGQFFFPGFVDTHIHASQYPNVGLFGKTTLLSWLETYTFPLESSLKDLAKAEKVYSACIRRTLAHGTTTAAYYATIDVEATNLLVDLCLSLGQRAFVGRVCMDNPDLCPDYYRDESAEEGLRKTELTVAHVEKRDPGFSLVSPIVTPRFAPSCTPQSLSALGRLAETKDLPIQTHVSENEGEIALVRSQFPDHESYAHVYDGHGLLTLRTVLAHAIHLTETEAALLRQRGTKVSHCPCSNSSLSSGVARVRWLWKKGLDVGLGTDVSGGYSPSMLESARQAVLVSRHAALLPGEAEKEPSAKLSVEEVLYLATRGGAVCLGLGDKVGGFEEGKQLDAQLVGLGNSDSNVDVFGWESWEERTAKWLYCGDDRNTSKVWVRGRLVHERSP